MGGAHRDLEERVARWFTPANFYLLREEIKMIDTFKVVETRMRGHPTFGKKVYLLGFKQRLSVIFYVSYSGKDVKCSCRKMEREGLLCRHILLRRDDIKVERLDELKDMGTEVFDIASEDALEFQEIKEFLEGWLWLEKRRRSGGVASGDDDDAASVEDGTPMNNEYQV
ncbi:hypothetical protein EJB05_35371, partial [Eragrostis curvula]